MKISYIAAVINGSKVGRVRIGKVLPAIVQAMDDGSITTRYLHIGCTGDLFLSDIPSATKIPVNFSGDEIDPTSPEMIEWVEGLIEPLFADDKWDLCDSTTNAVIRKATDEEAAQSWAESHEGGIDVDGRGCYVQF